MAPKYKQDGLPRRVYFKHGRYWFVDRFNKWHSLGRTKTEMYKNWADFSIDAPTQNTVSALCQRYIKDVLPKKSKAHAKNAENYLKKWVIYAGRMLVEDVRPMHIANFHDAMGAKTPVSANRALEVIRHCFSMSRRWGYRDDNPAQGVQRHAEKPRDRDVSLDEYLAVYEIASPVMQVAMEIARLTGMRQGDILALKWVDISPKGIYNHASKNNRKLLYKSNYSVTLTLQEAKGLLQDAISHYVLPSQKGGRFTSSGFQSNWRRLMDKAIKQGVIKERFTFHDIRALASNMQKTDELAAELLGNTKAATRKHYRRGAKVVEPNK